MGITEKCRHTFFLWFLVWAGSSNFFSCSGPDVSSFQGSIWEVMLGLVSDSEEMVGVRCKAENSNVG